MFVAACAAVPARAPLEDPAAAWVSRERVLARINQWDVRGRVSLRGADEGFSASLQWHRDDERHRIDLTGPLGGGRVRLTQDRHGAELRDASDRIERDSSAQQLLLRRTGWDLPLTGLNYWVLGLPVPGVPQQRELDAWGRLSSLDQLGWDVRFLDYAQFGAHELPSRVFIKRRADAVDSRSLEVRFVAEQWTRMGTAGE